MLPDIAALHGVEQPPQFHPEGDVYEHVRLMLSKIKTPDLNLALSILMHDVGKKATASVDENGRIRHSGHESVGADMSNRILAGLRYDNKTIDTVHETVKYHMQFKDVPHMRASTLKKMMARPHFNLELELHRIDCASSHGDLKYYEFFKHQLETMSPDEIEPPRLINGKDLLAMGIPPRPVARHDAGEDLRGAARGHDPDPRPGARRRAPDGQLARRPDHRAAQSLRAHCRRGIRPLCPRIGRSIP